MRSTNRLGASELLLRWGVILNDAHDHRLHAVPSPAEPAAGALRAVPGRMPGGLCAVNVRSGAEAARARLVATREQCAAQQSVTDSSLAQHGFRAAHSGAGSSAPVSCRDRPTFANPETSYDD